MSENEYIRSTDPAVVEKLEWWRDQKFGVIIHWGPYSQLGVFESWTLCQESDPWCRAPEPYVDDPEGYRAVYEKLPETFAAPAFDPKPWAEACARAGMRYVVFTTKHHDGFAMYDTALSDYKITNTPLGRDAAGEVFAAFRGEGLAAGMYFSKPDWHHPDYWIPGRANPDRFANYSTADEPERWERFKQFTHAQINELLTGYGPVDVLWLDGGWVKAPREDLDMAALAAAARAAQPGILVVDREVRGPYEDYRTPEQTVPDRLQPFPWESCVTLGPMWYTAGPYEQYKTVAEVIHLLCRIVARGGNLLLGIGPDQTGALPSAVIERLAGVGAWLETHGAAIYATRPCAPFEADGLLYTRTDDTVYAIGLLEPGQTVPEELRVAVSGVRPRRARMLGHDVEIEIDTAPDSGGSDTLVLRIPPVPATHAFALALEL